MAVPLLLAGCGGESCKSEETKQVGTFEYWKKLSVQGPVYCIADSGGKMLAGQDNGLIVSFDYQSSNNPVDVGIAAANYFGVTGGVGLYTPWQERVTAIASQGSVLIAGTSGDGVFRRSGVAGWRDVKSDFPIEGNVVDILAFGTNSVMVVTNGAVFTSTDAGLNFSRKRVFTDKLTCADRSNTGKTFIGSDAGVWISPDNGVTWQLQTQTTYATPVNVKDITGIDCSNLSNVDQTIAVSKDSQVFSFDTFGGALRAFNITDLVRYSPIRATGINSQGYLWFDRNPGVTWKSKSQPGTYIHDIAHEVNCINISAFNFEAVHIGTSDGVWYQVSR